MIVLSNILCFELQWIMHENVFSIGIVFPSSDGSKGGAVAFLLMRLEDTLRGSLV